MKTLLNKIKPTFEKFKSFEISTNIFIFTFVYSIFTTIIYNLKFFKAIYLINHSILSAIVSFVVIG